MDGGKEYVIHSSHQLSIKFAVDFRSCGVSSSLVGGKKRFSGRGMEKIKLRWACKNKAIRAYKLPPKPSSSGLQKIPQYYPR